MNFISSVFGYILDFIYEFVKNYGVAITLFSILLKLILLPLSIRQQKTMKKTTKLQEESKKIKDKYKNDANKANMEIMELYKREHLNPLSGCLSFILQFFIILAMFYLVRSPLTFMKKIDSDKIKAYESKIIEEQGEEAVSQSYPEISIIKNINKQIDENNNEEDSELNEMYINMNFLGLDLSDIPKENYKNVKVYIIPLLYVLTTFISIKITSKMTNGEKNNENKENAEDMATQMNKNMSLFIPITSVMISLVAPLGLALYWLVNNILMIIERIFIVKVLNSKEELQNE